MFLLNLTIEQDLCNIRCDYCWLTNQDQFVRRNQNILTVYSKKHGKVQDKKLSNLIEKIETILSNTHAPVLKVSGGEIFLLPEVINLLNKYSNNYAKIQILTNGTRLEQFPLDLLDNKKFAFQVSIDGHTEDSNQCRFGKATKHFTPLVINNILRLHKAYFNIEINSVITPNNIRNLKDFLFYVNKNLPKVTVYPFPVRFSEPDFNLQHESLIFLEKILELTEKLDFTLPPQVYMNSLYQTIKEGRSLPCYLPAFISSIDSDGDVSICPCGNIKKLGDYFDSSFVLQPVSIDNSDFKSIVNMKHDKCRECFTHFDVINLYVHGVIRKLELSKCGIFQDNDILQLLESYKLSLDLKQKIS